MSKTLPSSANFVSSKYVRKKKSAKLKVISPLISQFYCPKESTLMMPIKQSWHVRALINCITNNQVTTNKNFRLYHQQSHREKKKIVSALQMILNEK